MNLNEKVVFIPVSDLDFYQDYDDAVGYAGQQQISLVQESGILVLSEQEVQFRQHVQKFENSRK